MLPSPAAPRTTATLPAILPMISAPRNERLRESTASHLDPAQRLTAVPPFGSAANVAIELEQLPCTFVQFDHVSELAGRVDHRKACTCRGAGVERNMGAGDLKPQQGCAQIGHEVSDVMNADCILRVQVAQYGGHVIMLRNELDHEI